MRGAPNPETASGAGGASRRQGRPRSERGHDAILQAAGRLLVERGLAATSVDAIAAEAEVSKATIYRWWPSKEELMVEAVGHLRGELPPPPCTDDPRADLVVTVRDGLRRFAASEARGKLFPRLLDASVDSAKVADAWRRQLVLPRRRQIAAILERAIEGGLLPSGTDLELAVDLLVAPIIYRLHVTGAPATDALAERLVDVVWAGLAVSDNPPSARSVRRRKGQRVR